MLNVSKLLSCKFLFTGKTHDLGASLVWAAQGGGRFTIPGGVKGQAGCGPGLPDIVAGNSVHSRA